MSKPVIFGPYLLLDRIAYGGMAEVFRAKEFASEEGDRIIAIKRVLPSVSDNEQFIAMFRDEALITRSLQHENIAQVYDFDKLDGSYYLTMEYISGVDLKSYFCACEKEGRPMSPELAAHIVCEVAEGLGYAHRASDDSGSSLGLIHRDVSPQNILLSWDGKVKLIDFGIAKARQKSQRTDAGVLKGKFGYMSPEQVRGLPLSNRSDLFSLGAVLWELLTGHRAFDRESDYATMDAVRAVDLPDFEQVAPAVPESLRMICLKALQKDEEERYSRAESLARDLRRWINKQSQQVGAEELARALEQTFSQEQHTEQVLLASYKGHNADQIAESIRAAGASTEHAVQVTVSTPMLQPVIGQARAPVRISPAKPSVTPLAKPIATPSAALPAPLPLEPQRRRLKTERPSKVPFLLMILAVVLTVSGGWQAYDYWLHRPGSLSVSVLPPSVKVFVNFELLGTTQQAPDGRGSLFIEHIPHGWVDVRLEADGYKSLIEQVHISPYQTFSWQTNLPKVALPDGRIELSIFPIEARLSLDEDLLPLDQGQATVVLGDGIKKNLFVSANSFTPYSVNLGPLKPGSQQKMAIKLKLERWDLRVQPEPENARVSISSPGLKTVRGKGAQSLRGLSPNAIVSVSVSRRRCRRSKQKVKSSGLASQPMTVRLKCR